MKTTVSFQGACVATGGMGMLVTVPVKMKRVREVFPEAHHEGYYDPESGYDGQPEVGFMSNTSNHTFNVYDRYGETRIAGHMDSDHPVVAEFREFLINACK